MITDYTDHGEQTTTDFEFRISDLGNPSAGLAATRCGRPVESVSLQLPAKICPLGRDTETRAYRGLNRNSRIGNGRVECFARFARQCIDTKGLANECRSFFEYTVMNYCIVGIAGHIEHFHIGA